VFDFFPQISFVCGGGADDFLIFLLSCSFLFYSPPPSPSLQVPNAVLTVFYGFSPSFLKYGRSTIPNFQAWHKSMLDLLRQEGVNYVGMVDHRTLAKAYSEHGFYLYPTSFPETGCVALMKALAMGAVPITSRHINSTLPELTREWDLGPKGRTDGSTMADNHEWWKEWKDSVLKAATMSKNEIELHRQRMKEASRLRFLWGTVARTWDNVFERDRDSIIERRLNGGSGTSRLRPTLRDVYIMESEQ